MRLHTEETSRSERISENNAGYIKEQTLAMWRLQQVFHQPLRSEVAFQAHIWIRSRLFKSCRKRAASKDTWPSRQYLHTFL
jgi:hypothetical protein